MTTLRQAKVGWNWLGQEAGMRTVNIHAATTKPSRFVEAGWDGEESIGAPLATPPSPQRRMLGRPSGQLSVAADFDAPLPDDIVDAFEGR
jgi:hypothetical protein